MGAVDLDAVAEPRYRPLADHEVLVDGERMQEEEERRRTRRSLGKEGDGARERVCAPDR